MCLFFIVFFSCGYFENDGILFEKKIVGNIEFHQSKNSTNVDLVLAKSNGHYGIIVPDCKKIFYDSSNKKIYVEAILNQYNFNYYEFNILNAESMSRFEAYKENKIQKDLFDSLSVSTRLVFHKN